MRKDHTRDYVTEVFRLYARMGMRDSEAVKREIYERERSRHNDPALAVELAEMAVRKETPMLLDIMAAHTTLDLLAGGGRPHIARAVAAVYFVKPDEPLRRGEVSERVRWFALAEPTTECTVYRWLKEARLLCAAIRGLRIVGDAPMF